MKKTLDIFHEGVLAGFIFALWLIAVVLLPLQVNIFTPASDLTPLLFWLTAAYLVLNSFAFLYAVYMLAVLFRASQRRKASSILRWRIALYLYASVGLLLAIYIASQAIFF